MPHVRRRVEVTLAASGDEIRAAAAAVLDAVPGDAQPENGDRLRAPLGAAFSDAALEITGGSTVAGMTAVTIEAVADVRIPYFGWAIGPLLARQLRQGADHAATALRADLEGTPAPPPLGRSRLLPPVPFNQEATTLVATVAAMAAVANFGTALFGQNADSITDAFGASNRDLGAALAISRLGVLVALVAAGLADRRGRRQILLACFVGLALSNAISAVAPGFAVFTGAQLLTRAFANAGLAVAAIAVIEEAPDGARAWALSMFALAAGAGFAVAVVLLPVSDFGPQAWRLAFAISAVTVVLVRPFARDLRETRRFTSLAVRTKAGGRVRELFDRAYGWRFALVGLTAFLGNLFSAPSAQLTNRFLTDEHDFSNTSIAIFRAVTNGFPGLLGIVIAGRLAETRGRRPLGIVALAVGSVLQIAFFLGDGPVLWITSTLAIIAAACAGLAIGAFGTELFPTEVRGTSNALLLVCGVSGSAAGLLLATNLEDVVGGLGPAIALCGIAPILAALFVLPWLPEPADRPLDEVSPSEV